MTLSKLLKFLWDGVDIPITEHEIQSSVNCLVGEIKDEIYKELCKEKENDKINVKASKTLNCRISY